LIEVFDHRWNYPDLSVFLAMMPSFNPLVVTVLNAFKAFDWQNSNHAFT